MIHNHKRIVMLGQTLTDKLLKHKGKYYRAFTNNEMPRITSYRFNSLDCYTNLYRELFKRCLDGVGSKEDYLFLLQKFQYSADGGATYIPCGMEISYLAKTQKQTSSNSECINLFDH